MVSMIRAARRRGDEAVLHYCVRYAPPPLLAEVAPFLPDRALFVHRSGDPARPRFDPLRNLPANDGATHLYCCGPESLMDAVRAAVPAWPDERFHVEVFKPTAADRFVAEPFDVVLRSSGERLRVPADRSALDVLRAAGIPLPSSCELGLCGSCVCRYVEGQVIHRDSVLKVKERQDRIALCVSRARGLVVLDL